MNKRLSIALIATTLVSGAAFAGSYQDQTVLNNVVVSSASKTAVSSTASKQSGSALLDLRQYEASSKR